MGSLRARFVVASLVILLATLVTGLWSGISFVRLGNVVDRSLQGQQTTIDLTAGMASALEREDDALLLALTGDVDRARAELATERRAFDTAFSRLEQMAPDDAIASALHDDVAVYRAKGDALLATIDSRDEQIDDRALRHRADARDRYHADVNPALRRAVNACSALRERSFRALRDAGVRARDEAARGTWVVAIVSIVALGIAMFVALFLARSVLRPIRALTRSVDAMRRGDFQQRVARGAPDELGRLTDGFNRMAESLSAFQSSNLGEVIRAKETLEATIGALPDPVIVIDPSGLIASLNPPAIRVLGGALSEAVDGVDRPQDRDLQPTDSVGSRDAPRIASKKRKVESAAQVVPQDPVGSTSLDSGGVAPRGSKRGGRLGHDRRLARTADRGLGQ